MTTNMLTEVKIDSINISSKLINWKVIESYDAEIPTGVVHLLKTVDSLVTLQNGQSITIKRGFTTSTDEFVFEGQIVQIKTQIDRYVIIIRDKLIEAIKKNVTKSWDKDIDNEAGVGSEIFKDIVNNYVGLTADNTSVDSTGTTNDDKLIKFISRNEDAFSKMIQLANIYGYFIKRKPVDGLVYFKQKGFTDYGTLTVGTEIIKVPKWKENMEQLKNKITVFGASVEDNITETFSGDAAETEFTLSKTPNDTQVHISGVLQTRGVTGASSTFDYTIDPEIKLLKFESAPASGTNNISITYGANIPIPVVVKDTVSIATYGGPDQTPHEYAHYLQQVVSVEDAEKEGRSLLTKFSTPFNSTDFLLSNTQLALSVPEVGNLITVVDNTNNKNLQVVILEIEKNYPHANDKIQVGDQEFRLTDNEIDIAERLRQVIESLNTNTDLLTSLFDLTRSIQYKRRYMKMTKNSISGDIFILGHYNFAIVGTSKIGGSVTDLGTFLISQGQNTYLELFYDNDFKDAGNTTGVWDTTNKELVLETTEIGQSSAVVYGMGIITSATISATGTGTSLNDVVRLKMDNNAASTTVSDSSGNSHTGTSQQNTDVLTTAGQIDRALTFNGTTDYITIADHADFNFSTALTVVCWVNLTDLVSRQIFVSKSNHLTTEMEWSFRTEFSGKVQVRFGTATGVTGPAEQTDDVVLTAGVWHHVAFTYSAGIVIIYIDGFAVDSTTIDGTIVTSLNNETADIQVGVESAGGFNFLDGIMDEIRIFGSVLTPTQILTIFNNSEIIGDFASYSMSADGGNNWESATFGVPLVFANTGSDLRWKILSTGGTINVKTVEISYEV